MRTYLTAAMLAGMLASPAAAQTIDPLTGFRIEGLVGYDRADVPGDDADGVAYGVAAGYDVRMGGAVAGVEAELSESTIDECTSDALQVGDTLCASTGRDIYVGGRVGAAVAPNSLVYAKAGYTNARLNTDYSTGIIGEEVRTSENLDGVRVGAGAEFGIGPNSYVKTEYRYSNYEQDFERHQVVAGFGFRF